MIFSRIGANQKENELKSTSIGYETTLVFKGEVNDDLQRSFLEKVKGIVSSHGGTVVLAEDWGRRKFAYPIQKETRGAYHYLVYSGDNKVVAEIERNMRINEGIMRFLTVKLDTDFDPATYKKRTPNAVQERSVSAPVVERHVEGDLS